MKAVQFNSFGTAEVLGVVDLAKPQPEGEEVLIEVGAAGVSFVDIRQRRGAYNRAGLPSRTSLTPRFRSISSVPSPD
jgi:NADPH:quinone reductase-like Zn-dependent oxidoreductase